MFSLHILPVLTCCIPENLDRAVLQVSLSLSGERLSPLECSVCVYVSTVASTLYKYILTMKNIIAIKPKHINIFVSKTTFFLSIYVVSCLRLSISSLDSFLVFWILFFPVEVTVSSVLTFTLTT